MTVAVMDGPNIRRKPKVNLTPTYNNTSPAPSRPSSRTSYRSTSRPASPTKSFVSTSSPLVTTRPKAKVNTSAIRKTPSSSSATTTTPRIKSTKDPESPSAQNNFSPTRPGSPVKLTSRLRDGALSPPVRIQPTVVRVRPSSVSSSTPQAPELRNRSLTASSDALRPSIDSRKRQGSVALNHAVSYSNLQVSSRSSVIGNSAQSELGVPSDTEHNGLATSAPVKIRSKVTAMVKNISDASNTPPTLDSPVPTGRPIKPRTRAPSISSSSPFLGVANSPPAPLYPITTASPAANPHRYTTARTTPAAPRYPYIPSLSQQPSKPQQQDEFRPFARTAIAAGGGLNQAKVDPASIPLPPQSPPISAISVSSHSSVSISRSSTSYVHDSAIGPESPVSVNFKRKLNGSPQSLRNTLDNLLAYASTREDGESGHEGGADETSEVVEDEERKVKAEAKSNRKIADLEITNRSLLAINASLEKTKDRQAKEIRELKRKLRESRLILPPNAYRAVKSSLEPDEAGDDEEDLDSDSSSDQDEGRAGAGRHATDETYGRIKLLLESLLDSGKRALEKTNEDYMDAKGGTRVLTAEEVESWRDEGHQDPHGEDEEDEDEDRNRLLSPTPQPDTFASTLDDGPIGLGLGISTWPSSLPSPKPPPILITESP